MSADSGAEPADGTLFDAIIILGGGLTAEGAPHPFVTARLDEGARHRGKFYVCLSRGTTHKPPPRDDNDFPVDEATASAQYLVKQHRIPAEKILKDTWSLDTIGNAVFAMAMICEPMGLRSVLVVTSEFHLPRSKLIFDWIVPLWIEGASVTYSGAPNVGLEGELLEGRRKKEEGGCANVKSQASKHTTRAAVLSFLLVGHGAYNCAPKAVALAPVDQKVLDSY